MRTLRTLAVMAVAASSFAAGSWFARRDGSLPAEASGRSVLYYHDPMHPAYRSDKPGVAPDCGMRLAPVYASDGERSAEVGVAGLPPGTLSIPPERQQLLGLRFANVERGSGRRTIRTVGRVAPDEGRVHRVTIGVEGWVSRVESGASTGSFVRRGQPLAAVASRDILSPQQAYVYALESLEELKAKATGEQQRALVESQLAQARQGLEAIGMSGPQMRELARTRTPASELLLASPVPGIVLARNADQGQRYDGFAELFRIAALDRVWVLADISPEDIRFLRPGTTAEVGLPGQARIRARVGDVPGQFDPGARTFKVRLEVDNRRAELRPDMLLDVDVELALPETVVVDRDAVIDSGRRQVVFVDRGGGRLEPRPVRTGWRAHDRVEIVDGVSPGERVAVSGQFLLDSESGLRAALTSWSATRVVDPSCGMEIDPASAVATREYRGERYYFCSRSCLQQFDAHPERLQARDAEGSMRTRADASTAVR